ncbi:hypothetical protein STAQ_37400 [Allostella sp. ATCC 35155]|nr:hypothetical protein STAQ_37400 [Stella sp. ATCC 35155]
MTAIRNLAAAAALLAATAAAAEPPAVGTRILWQDMDAALPGPTWTVTAAGPDMVEVAETDAGTLRRIRIAAGLFPARTADGAATRFDRTRLAALPPLEPGRVVTFDAVEDGPAGSARWFVHVAVAERRIEATPAGAHPALAIEHHRRGTGPDGRPLETVTEWAVAPALGLPVAIRTWRLAEGRAILVGDRRALAVLPP